MAYVFNPFTGNMDWTIAGVTIGDTVTSGTTGSVLFLGTSNVLAQDNANFFWDDTNNRLGILTAAPSNALSLGGEAARIFAMERRTTANTAGSALTIRSGGATSGATNKSSGSLTLASGISTGTGAGGSVIIQTPAKGTSGTADNALTTRLSVAGSTGSITATSSASTGSITGLTHNVTGSALGVGGSFAGQVWSYSSIFDSPALSYGLQMQLLLDSQTGSGGSTANGFAFEIYESNSLGPGTFGVDTTAVSGFIRHSSSPAGHTFTGFNVDVQTASGAGGCSITLYETAASALAANVTSWTAFHAVNPASTATVTTAYGLKIDNLTEATTSYAIHSSGGISVHAGNFFFGGTTTPTAKVHLAAGTTAVSTAPLKFTTGTNTTVAEVGTMEYNNRHYLTNSSLIRGPIGVVLPFDNFADVSVGGAEADIYSATTLANTFASNGDKLVATYGGNFVTLGTESVQLKVNFAGTTIWDSTAIAISTGTTSWAITVELIRVSSTVIRYTVRLNTTGASGFVYCSVGELTGLTLSGTNILKTTGTSSGVSSGVGDIIGKMSSISFLPAA